MIYSNERGSVIDNQIENITWNTLDSKYYFNYNWFKEYWFSIKTIKVTKPREELLNFPTSYE